ncbi:MAG: efflux RND transporter periplasmic adaptor subunit [Elusimicrobiota bacterium]|nr:efflux RND transporter periplasmic adaptor subunit [Endomicrobiia bacterium]MDW8165610.1 efflux RND transporter periplasmic adaptor subunit [Elusimicrobiota bacterium]
MKRKIIIGILTFGLIALVIFRIFQTIQKHKISKQLSQKEQEFIYTVKVKPVEYKKIADSINFVGEVKGINEVSVVPKVVGRLTRKIKDEGSFVKRDEIICEIDRDEPVLKYSLYELKSPIDGILVKYFADVGSMVSPQTPICIISDTQKVKITFNIAENLVNKLNKNSYVKFETETGKIFSSKNIQLSNYIDPLSRSMEVKVIVDNPEGDIKSGSFIKGELIFNEKVCLVVPSEAVYEIDGRHILFVVKDNYVEEREVKIGLNYKNYIEIIQGVNHLEKVVYQGGELLADGMRVEVLE